MRRWLSPKQIFAIHSWLGLNTGLLLLVICLTGAFATISDDLEWLSDSRLRIASSGAIDWDALHAAARNEYPQAHVLSISEGEKRSSLSAAWYVQYSFSNNEYATARIDPYSARIVAPASRFQFRSFFRQLHYNFFNLLGPAGFYIVALMSFPLIFSLITGLWIHRNWWKGFFTLSRGKGPRVLISSLHRLLGLWATIFGMIIAITGIWYLVEWAVIPLDYTHPPGKKISEEAMATRAQNPSPLPLSELVAKAKTAYPELKVNTVILAQDPNEPIVFTGPSDAWLVRDRASALQFDPYTGEVVLIQKPQAMNPVKRWVETADPLHFGNFGGLPTKLLWAFLGLVIPVMILSGAYLSFLRLSQGKPVAPTKWTPRAFITMLVFTLVTWHCVNAFFNYQTASRRLGLDSSQSLSLGIASCLIAFCVLSTFALVFWLYTERRPR